MRIISRSSINQWQRCPRAYYHKYHNPEGGPGVEPVDRPDYYALGIAFHEGGEILLRGGTGAAAGEACRAKAESLGLSERWQYWCVAICLAWERTEMEEFHSRYDVLSVEQDVLVPLTSDVSLYGRADAVLRDRDTGALYVWNWKTTADLRDWNKRFFFDIQTMVEAAAVEAQLGEPVDGVLYGAVWKGPIYKGFTTSRLIGGYCNREKGTYSANREKGHTAKFTAWNESFPFGTGLDAWIAWLPESTVRGHFAISAPQAVNTELCAGWLRQIARAESDAGHILDSGSEIDILDFFAQHVGDNCPGCPYLDMCAGRSTVETLVRDGRLAPRDDSHLRDAAIRAEGGGG